MPTPPSGWRVRSPCESRTPPGETPDPNATPEGGSGTITIGDRTWTFAVSACAFSEAEAEKLGLSFDDESSVVQLHGVTTGVDAGWTVEMSSDRFLGDDASLYNVGVQPQTFWKASSSILRLQGVSPLPVEKAGRTVRWVTSWVEPASGPAVEHLPRTPGTFEVTCS